MNQHRINELHENIADIIIIALITFAALCEIFG